MTVPTEKVKVNHTGDGIETSFVYDFPVLAEEHMNVYLDDVPQASGFTVTGIGEDAGGTVDFDTAPGSGVVVTLLRWVPQTQETDYVPYDKFPAETHEDALDLAAMGRQQLQENMTKVILLPPSWVGGPLYLPPPIPFKVLATDATSQLFWDDPAPGGVGASTFTELLDTPPDYSGAASWLVAVNSGGNALEFLDPATFIGSGDVRQTAGDNEGAALSAGVMAFWGVSDGWVDKDIDGSPRVAPPNHPFPDYPEWTNEEHLTSGQPQYYWTNVVTKEYNQTFTGQKAFDGGRGRSPGTVTRTYFKHTTNWVMLDLWPDYRLQWSANAKNRWGIKAVQQFDTPPQSGRLSLHWLVNAGTEDPPGTETGLILVRRGGGDAIVTGSLNVGGRFEDGDDTNFPWGTSEGNVRVERDLYVDGQYLIWDGVSSYIPFAPGGGDLVAGSPLTDGELVEVEDATGKVLRSKAGLASQDVADHLVAGAPHADHADINRDAAQGMPAGDLKMAVRSSLPATPDADTLYFITT